MSSETRLTYLIGGPFVFLLGYLLLRGGLWAEERFQVHFVGSGSLAPWVLMLAGVYLLARGLLGI